MAARGTPSGPGKTAPRLINDLLDHDPRNVFKHGRNLLVDPGRKYNFNRGPALSARKDRLDCRHKLMRKEQQTNAPRVGDEPDSSTEYKVAAYCTACLHHFDIAADFWRRNDRKTPCSLSDELNPLHHLQLARSQTAKEHKKEYGVNKYDQLIEAHRFVCSGPECPLQLDIKISPPRLNHIMLAYILDPLKLDVRGQREIKNDPERYQGMSPIKPLQALGYLRQYLVDAKGAKSKTELKRIARRNKKYMLTFADECDELFEYLDFKPIEEASPEPEEGPNYFWQLPIITDLNRHFIDDVVHEIDLLMARRPLDEGPRAIVNHIPALKDIERSLGCFDYPTRNRTVDLSVDEHPCYISLGAVYDFPDKLLEWSYERQCECDPSNKPYYLDCLEDLATGRQSADLQMKVVMATSAGEVGQKAIEDSYRFFNLDPDSVEGDDHIMGLYKSRIESAPRQKDAARECLLTIAKHRKSEKIEALANDRTMSFEDALEFLNVPVDTDSDSIEAAAVALSLESSDKAKIARALRVIANQRSGDFTLQRAAASMESGTGSSALDVGDAYHRLQIGTRNVPDETVFTYFQSLSNGAPSGSKDSYTEALRVIALDRRSNFLLRKLEDPNADVQAGTAEPVGLDNIGNTCYLNSLLQYYYTIKAVRDMVINFQQHRMSLNEEDIKNKKVGGRFVDKSEIIKAQKFVEELHNLFENLKTASTRSVKPTRELAELTIFSSAAVADFRRASISSPHGPPNLSSIMNGPVYGPQWPPPPPPLPTTEEEDIEMVDHPPNKNAENGDDSSEATLVDLEQLPPSYSETAGNEESSPGADAVMVNGEDASPDKSSASEKPPPIPPRNKSGLVIQTNENKDLLPNDELWKFGSQQDVTEVIGNVMFRLQCAIKPTSIEETSGAQIDIIRDTFFGANTVYTQKARSLEQKTEAWPSIIVFPGKVGRDIYEALDVVYDEQQVEIDNTTVPQYASLSKLPPILQIHIQRTDFDHETHRAFKNRNPVVFPETIYLDRYVDSGDPNSAIMRRRRETWSWKERLQTLEARHAALKNEQAQISVPDALLATKDFVSSLQEEEIEGIEVDPALPEALEERISEVAAELEAISGRIDILRKRIQGQFVDMREYEYKLQSVFIHRGEAGGGHYWIYIYDFEHDIWREYNDEWVSEVKDRRTIFEQQGGAGGTPYYLVYVKSSNIKDLVEAVCRDVQEVQMTEVTEAWPDLVENGVSSGANEGEDISESRHVEYVKPRPLRPKPAVSEPMPAWETAWEGNEESNIGAGGDPRLDANGKPW